MQHTTGQTNGGTGKGNAGRLSVVLIALLAVLAAILLAVFILADRTKDDVTVKDTQAFESPAEETETVALLNGIVYRTTDDIETMLFIGTDQSGNEATEDEERHGAMADTLMALIINHTKQEYTVLQFNRDTITNIHLIDEAGEGEAMADLQLCTAHYYGGTDEINCENTIRSVSELLGGVPIGTYYSLSWEGMTTLNTVVDGVTVTIENDFSQVDPTLVMGETITLTDEQAYTFLRTRYDVDDGENLGRMSRHRQYLTAWVQKVKEKTAEDATFPAKVFNDLSPYAVTNLKGSQINKKTGQLSGYANLGIVTFEGTTHVGDLLGDGLSHMEFYVDPEARVTTLKSLYNLEATSYDPDEYGLEEYTDYAELLEESEDEDEDYNE